MCNIKKQRHFGTHTHAHTRQPTNRPHKLLSATSNACRNGEMGFISRINARPCGFTRSPLIEVCYVYDMHDGCYSWFHGSWYKWMYSVCCRFELRIRLNALTYDLKWQEARRDTSSERTDDNKSEKQIYSYFAFIIIILSFREPNEIRVDDILAYGVCSACVCERAYYMSYDYDDFHWIIFMIPLCKYLSDEPMCASERANDRTVDKDKETKWNVSSRGKSFIVLFQVVWTTTLIPWKKSILMLFSFDYARRAFPWTHTRQMLMLFANERVIYYYVSWLYVSLERWIWLLHYRNSRATSVQDLRLEYVNTRCVFVRRHAARIDTERNLFRIWEFQYSSTYIFGQQSK